MRFIMAAILGSGIALTPSLPSWSQSCTTNQIQSGKLGLVAGDMSALSSRPDLAPLGQLASWTVTCTGGVAVNVNPPIPLGPTPPTPINGVEVWDGSPLSGGNVLVQVTSSGAAPFNLPAPVSNRTLFFHLYISSGGTPLIPGTYAYRVPLAVTPL